MSRDATEHPRSSNLTKYDRWYGMNDVPSCAIGITWVFDKTGLGVGVYGSRTAWVPDYRVWALARGRWSVSTSDVRVGDIITYRSGMYVQLLIRGTHNKGRLRFWTVGFSAS